ncbi:MAG TPA: polysaccharide deacetylase family protein [Candidatus Angelobacter sp.]|nr:polysaccharide deacetylase family protein [Candidatus Angelobacter sp.]
MNVLAYHELSPDVTDYSYALSCGQFEQHLQLAAQLQGQSAKARPPIKVSVSFDDGHLSNYTHALPLLEKYGCKAIFFVIVGRIGQHKDFMTWDHLRELAALGHKVESHSWSHKFLTDCLDSDLHDELTRSRKTLEDRLSSPVEALSAPHGRWNRRLLRACAGAGYRQLYTSDPWPSSVMREVEVIGRLVMVQSLDATRLLHWLTMGRAETGLRRMQFLLKQSARRVLGNKLYYHLWARFSGWNGPEDTMLNGTQ